MGRENPGRPSSPRFSLKDREASEDPETESVDLVPTLVMLEGELMLVRRLTRNGISTSIERPTENVGGSSGGLAERHVRLNLENLSEAVGLRVRLIGIKESVDLTPEVPV